MERIDKEERRRRRGVIRAQVLDEIDEVIRFRLNGHMTVTCRDKIHSGCDFEECLCTCHDQDDSQYTHRCRSCGQDVQYVTWTMMPNSAWVHILSSDHPADPVKKKDAQRVDTAITIPGGQK